LSDAIKDIDVDEIMDSLERDFDLQAKRRKNLELELLEIEQENHGHNIMQWDFII